MKSTSIEGFEIRGPLKAAYSEILSPAACRFLAGLVREFGPRREQLLPAGPIASASSTKASFPIFCRRQPPSAAAPGGFPRRPPTSLTEGPKSRAPSNARW